MHGRVFPEITRLVLLCDIASILIVAKVGFDAVDYQLEEENITAVCVNVEGTLEKPITVNYTLSDATAFGKHILTALVDQQTLYIFQEILTKMLYN